MAEFFIDESNNGKSVFSQEYAKSLDESDSLGYLREEFLVPNAPENSGREKVIYLCGNSLGLQPKQLKSALQNQLDKWATQGVEGHFEEPTPWLTIDDIIVESTAKLVGARNSEVVAMNGLTSNLHFMMCAFYRPDATRFKIITEKKAFPSDTHAVVSQILHHGYDPSTALVEIAPREGESTLRTEDILNVIRQHGETISLVMFSGVQYYTGQFFNLKEITAVGHEYNCIVGFDLAHAVGNVPLELHDWNVDFACWCSYKYLNCGAGSIGGCFIHDNHTGVSSEPSSNLSGQQTYRNRLSGWWGHRLQDRFLMAPDFIPCEGAYGFRLSNPSILLVTCLRTSLDLFDKAGIHNLRKKSLLLTSYLEYLLSSVLPEHVTIFTPSDPQQRGCQLSLSFQMDIDDVFKRIQSRGVMCDVRRPNVMRIAPTPLYNSFTDVFEFVTILKAALLDSEEGREDSKSKVK